MYLADLQDVTEMELYKCVTERAGTGTGRHGTAPAANGAISVLPKVPMAIVTSAAVDQWASGSSPKCIWLSHMACSLQKEPQMEKTVGGMETEGRRQRQTGRSGDKS